MKLDRGQVRRLGRRGRQVIRTPRKYFGVQALLYYRYRLVHAVAPWSRLDDRAYLTFKFREKFGHRLHLRDPRTFNEKLNWLKLYDRKPVYTVMADKFRSREFVAARVGSDHLPHLHGAYRGVDEIDWDALPDRFAIKVNHGCKSNILCPDKQALDVARAEVKLRRWLGENGYYPRREWPYKDIEPRIVVEEFLDGDPEWGLLDYKFFCFDGRPRYVAVDFDRYSHHSQFFYDLEWNRQPFTHELPTPDRDCPRPAALEEMVGIATELARGTPFVRVDLYATGGRVLVGELTFHPAGSLKKITPERFDRQLGDLITLPRN